MKKYKVVLTLKEKYELFVEAEDWDTAYQIAIDTDIAEFDETGMTTEQFDVDEVTPITDGDNV